MLPSVNSLFLKPMLSDLLRRYMPKSWCIRVCENHRHPRGYFEDFHESLMRKRSL